MLNVWCWEAGVGHGIETCFTITYSDSKWESCRLSLMIRRRAEINNGHGRIQFMVQDIVLHQSRRINDNLVMPHLVTLVVFSPPCGLRTASLHSIIWC
jgi:hypothetical protein